MNAPILSELEQRILAVVERHERATGGGITVGHLAATLRESVEGFDQKRFGFLVTRLKQKGALLEIAGERSAHARLMRAPQLPRRHLAVRHSVVSEPREDIEFPLEFDGEVG